ncbi:BRCT domain protein [Talaromyces stipitatus ATCC 10500]|uniref:BRCT domain protein n=1 Tax=Talaromyces stipitatus (strain ATCC 10500 / CBS 375.48 / QM 6759 / NRRL 1006) TaxID=441959 RepID=B8M270_TALSN|nr:BRCT domain protein [Talaromyces stipitatus ATCC 10500]EED21534.1 BRCT domain protein [Talaromyces stipitatus ATCC 10500]
MSYVSILYTLNPNVDRFKRHTVQRARDLNINIVAYDWFEDSLMSKAYRPKREGPYLQNLIWESAMTNTKGIDIGMGKIFSYRMYKLANVMLCLEKVLGEFQNEARAVVSDIEKLGYHLYIDKNTGVSYSATLIDIRLSNIVPAKKNSSLVLVCQTFSLLGPQNSHEVYEMNKEPHTYTTYVKYTRVGVASKDMLAPKGSSLDSTLFAFKRFFHVKTGVEWKDGFGNSKLSSGTKLDKEGKIHLEPPE